MGTAPATPECPCPPRQVVQRIKAVETETRLLVVDKETDEYLCSLRLTCTEDMVHNGILLSPALPPTKGLASDNGEVWKPQLDVSGGSLQRHSHSFSSHGSRKVRAQRGCGQQLAPPWGFLPLWPWLVLSEKPSVCGLGSPGVPSCPLGSLTASGTGCLGAVRSLPSSVPEGLLSCWGGCGGCQCWGRVSDPTVSQPGSQPAQHRAVAKLELTNDLLSLHSLQEGGNIWGERVRSFLLK